MKEHKRSSRKGAPNFAALNSEHLDALGKDSSEFDVTELGVPGLSQVEGTTGSENRNSRLHRGVGVLAISQKEPLQGSVLNIQTSPGREVTPKLGADCIVLDLVLTSAKVPEPAGEGRINLKAAGGSPAIEPAKQNGMQDTKRDLRGDGAKSLKSIIGAGVGDALTKPS